LGGIKLFTDLLKKTNGKENYNDTFREYVENYWSASSIEAQLVGIEIQKLLLKKDIEKESVRVVVSLAGIAVTLGKTRSRGRKDLKKRYIEENAEWVLNSSKKSRKHSVQKLEFLLEKHFPDLQ